MGIRFRPGEQQHRRATAVVAESHLDVVPALKEHWKRDPFRLDEANGFFYGRGALDRTGGWLAAVTHHEIGGLLEPPAQHVFFFETRGTQFACEIVDELRRFVSRRDALEADHAREHFAGFGL
ncbi:MAG: M20/M25/M40 family metallo-hydrolase [Gammaproteobacteria bacterium]|nr:M20/M25/M40 family metallo-hydrolase [Gammaproteobacteria bacterium]